MDYNEYLNQIIRFNGDKDLLMMREKYNDPSTLKWHEYKELIACSAVSTILEPIWCLEGTYYDYQPEENAHQVRFHNANEEELLLSFWEENEEGLTALMQGLPPHEKQLEDIRKEVYLPLDYGVTFSFEDYKPEHFIQLNPISSWQDKNFCYSEEGLRAALKAEGADMNSFRVSVSHQPIKGLEA